MDRKHWGEFTDETPTETQYIPDVTTDIERAMDKTFLDQYDEEDEPVELLENIRLPTSDPLMLYAISLHKYANDIADAVDSDSKESLLEDAQLEIPPLPDELVKQESSSHAPTEFTNFAQVEEVTFPDLSKTVVRNVLIKSIATMFAHLGYETSEQSALDMLSDVLDEFLKKITYNYKCALEDEAKMQSSGFPHPIERVLVQLGLGGMKGLSDYYKFRLLKYINVLRTRCTALNEKYHQSKLIPALQPTSDRIKGVVRVKVEEEEDVVEVENPQVHFPTIDGGVSFSFLETGYQLLNSLEAEENMQGLGEADEELTTETPGVGPASSEADVSHLSPFNKKRRFK